MYKVIPQLSEGAEIKDYIKHVSGDKLETDNAFKIDLPKVYIQLQYMYHVLC